MSAKANKSAAKKNQSSSSKRGKATKQPTKMKPVDAGTVDDTQNTPVNTAENKPQETEKMSEAVEESDAVEETAKSEVKRGRKPVPEDESREDKFQRLATKRVNKALKAISLIGNLAQKNNYGYTDSQVKKIRQALEIKVVGTMELFSMTDPENEPTFEL